MARMIDATIDNSSTTRDRQENRSKGKRSEGRKKIAFASFCCRAVISDSAGVSQLRGLLFWSVRQTTTMGLFLLGSLTKNIQS
jgi:hypothetical protein